MRKVDVRIIAATNRDLREMAAAGRFREDLFFRLSAFHIDVPPLRERRQDIPDLLRFLLSRSAKRFAIDAKLALDPEAEEILRAYGWPGNVREMENVLDRAAILAEDGRISVADLPPHIVPAGPAVDGSPLGGGAGGLREQVRRFEHGLILRVIEEEAGDRRLAAGGLIVGRRPGKGIAALLGARPADWAAGDTALEEFVLAAGPEHDAALTQLFIRRSLRQLLLMEPILTTGRISRIEPLAVLLGRA
jgi:DNA-binding NtrC family response regulator